MRVTDNSDKVINDYNPLIDIAIDVDAPYIDFDYLEDVSSIEVSKTGVYDTLFYNDEKILIVGEVSEVEIRFYSTENPNENYRTGQKHFKGKILSIKKCDEGTDSGYSIKVDTSKEYYAKVETITINQTYVDICKARCIAILYFNSTGRVISELVIPIKDWFSSKVYLNSAIVIDGEDEKIPYKVGDIVDIVYYIKVSESEDGKIEVENADITGRITDLKLTCRSVNITDEDGVERNQTIYYNIIYIDASSLYNKRVVSIASTVIRSMVLHPIIPEV